MIIKKTTRRTETIVKEKERIRMGIRIPGKITKKVIRRKVIKKKPKSPTVKKTKTPASKVKKPKSPSNKKTKSPSSKKTKSPSNTVKVKKQKSPSIVPMKVSPIESNKSNSFSSIKKSATPFSFKSPKKNSSISIVKPTKVEPIKANSNSSYKNNLGNKQNNLEKNVNVIKKNNGNNKNQKIILGKEIELDDLKQKYKKAIDDIRNTIDKSKLVYGGEDFGFKKLLVGDKNKTATIVNCIISYLQNMLELEMNRKKENKCLGKIILYSYQNSIKKDKNINQIIDCNYFTPKECETINNNFNFSDMKKTRFTSLKHAIFILGSYFLLKQNIKLNILLENDNEDSLLLEYHLLKLLDCNIKPNNYDTNKLHELGMSKNIVLYNVFNNKKSKPNLPKVFEILEKIFYFKNRLTKKDLSTHH